MELNVASQRFDQIVQEINSLTRTISSEVHNTAGFFKGNAAGSFRTVMANYDQNAAALNRSLQTISGAIHQSARQFHSTDETSTSALNQAASGLNM